MVRSSFWAALASGIALAALTAVSGETPPLAPSPRAKEVDKAVDITAEVKAWNSSKFAAPPSSFRQGHVTPRKLDPRAISRTPEGFVVQLPSHAPIPTPTVWDGKVYVSGGFHSKEFYCLNAGTGEAVWAIDIDDDGPSAAVCYDDVCVFNTESCTIFAVNAKTGQHLWSYWLGDPLTSTPTIANGVVFTSYPAGGGGGAMYGKPDGKNANPAHPPCSHVLIAMELKTGKILWQRWIDSDVMSAPVAVDEDVYIASFGGVVYDFKQKDGEVRSAVKSRATSAPVVVGKDVFYSCRLDADGAACPQEAQATASRATNKLLSNSAPKDAVYLDEKVQGGGGFAKAAAKLDAGNGFGGGAPMQANPTAALKNVGYGNVSSMQAFQGSRVLHMGGMNYSCMGDRVVCNDPQTGREVWSHALEGDLKKQGGFLGAPPAAAGGYLFLTTLKGDVMQMDSAGKVVKTWATKSPTRFQAAVEAGRIFVGTQDGKLICLNTSDAKLTGWSCWGGNAGHTGVGVAAK